MKVAISGANGFIGRHLAAHFEKLDYAVTRIARDQFERPSFDAASLAGSYAKAIMGALVSGVVTVAVLLQSELLEPTARTR